MLSVSIVALSCLSVALSLPMRLEPLSIGIRQGGEPHAHQEERLELPRLTFNFPGESEVIDSISTNFSCSSRTYGYYADIGNECRAFHVCYPNIDSRGEQYMARSSFFCPIGTLFSQESLTCDVSDNVLPCNQQMDFKRLGGSYGYREVNREAEVDTPSGLSSF